MITSANTVKRFKYSPFEGMLNGLAAAAEGLGIGFADTDIDRIIWQVMREEGGDDGWRRNTKFLDATLKLSEVINRSPLTPLGGVLQRGVMLKAMRNRARMYKYKKENPQFRDVKIEKPVFIVGFPRTGTTVVQNLLGMHPQTYTPEYWEMLHPVPEHEDHLVDWRKRLKRTRRILQAAYWFAPEQAQIHHITERTAEEDWTLMALTFAVMNFDLQMGMPAYGDYLMEAGMEWAYQELREMFQVMLMQHRGSGLVTKCPEHLWFLDDLLKVFPDAGIVWTHRDPFPTIASYASMTSLSRRAFFGDAKPEEIGPYIANRFHLGVTRATEVEVRLGSDRFCHVHQEDLKRNPLGEIYRIREKFGVPWGEGTEEKALAWLRSDHRKDGIGRHRYDPAVFGLDKHAVHERFADYIDRFGIKVG